MKKVLAAILLLAILSSCDNGEIIVTSFDLQESNLKLCGTSDKKVLYAINNENVFESMSLQLQDNGLEDSLQNVLTTQTSEDLEISLNNSNRLVYRLYDSEVPSDYFCNQIPPREPRVQEEYWSTTGGKVVISTNFNDENADADTDGDGIKNSDEGWNASGNSQDTDGDGIPDYLDIDDDGDNVKTIRETSSGDGDPTAEGYLDTDQDGTPNYLDSDDDDDGAPTRLEVSKDNLLNPEAYQEAENIPNFLNNQISTIQQHNLYIENTIKRQYRSQVNIYDFKLVKQDGSGEEIRFDVYNLGYFDSGKVNFTLEPNPSEAQ